MHVSRQKIQLTGVSSTAELGRNKSFFFVPINVRTAAIQSNAAHLCYASAADGSTFDLRDADDNALAADMVSWEKCFKFQHSELMQKRIASCRITLFNAVDSTCID